MGEQIIEQVYVTETFFVVDDRSVIMKYITNKERH